MRNSGGWESGARGREGSGAVSQRFRVSLVMRFSPQIMTVRPPAERQKFVKASQIRAVDGRGHFWCGRIQSKPRERGVARRVNFLASARTVRPHSRCCRVASPSSSAATHNETDLHRFSAPTVCNFSDPAVRLLLQTQAYQMTQVGPPGIAPLAINISDCEPGEPGESSPVGAGLQGARA